MNRSTAMRSSRRRAAGFSLIELMVALILGLLVTSAAIGMFLSNSRTHNATQNLGRLQENARVAFELMAREVREASANPCSNALQVTNRLTSYTGSWWSNWDRASISRGIVGYDNGALAGTVAGTDALEILGGSASGVLVTAHASPTFTVNTTTHGFITGDVLMVCDNRLVAIFQAMSVSGASITHSAGTNPAPGNSNVNLGINNTAFTFNDNAMVVRLMASRWYVRANGRGGRSLYRLALRGGTTASAIEEEVVENVQNMQVQYLIADTNAYVNTVAANRWPEVQAIRVQLTLVTPEAIGTNGQPVQRLIHETFVLRNRVI